MHIFSRKMVDLFGVSTKGFVELFGNVTWHHFIVILVLLQREKCIHLVTIKKKIMIFASLLLTKESMTSHYLWTLLMCFKFDIVFHEKMLTLLIEFRNCLFICGKFVIKTLFVGLLWAKCVSICDYLDEISVLLWNERWNLFSIKSGLLQNNSACLLGVTWHFRHLHIHHASYEEE